MSKELDAMKSYEKIDNTLCLNNNRCNIEFAISEDENIDCKNAYEMTECLDNIKQELQELQSIKNTNPSEALKLFEEFKGILLKNIVFLDTDLQRLNTIKQYILKSQEQEKVLKIIKEKYVHIPQLLCAFENQLEEANPLEFYYNGQVGINVPMPLTEEEFDLLKEYLK